jgi:hypothetical protein
MRKLLAAGVGGVIVAAGATVALAAGSPAITVTPTVSSHKAGTSKHPRGVKLDVKINWQTLGAANQPIVQRFKILFPKGSLYNGAKYPSCSLGTLNGFGPSSCRRSSIMGSGTGNAYADTVITHPQITVVNGGAHRVYFYTVLNNPARVQSPVIGNIHKIGGKYAYELDVSVPQVLQVVAGVPIELTSLNVVAGTGNTWLATTSCPGGHWPFSVTTYYNTGGSASYTASVACHH